MSENDNATTTSGDHFLDQGQTQLAKIADRKHRFVKKKVDQSLVDNSLWIMEKCAADEPTAQVEQHANEETKKNINQQQPAAGLEVIRKPRTPLSVSEQFDHFNQANGLASPVASYYWRPIPPALKKLNGMDRYDVRRQPWKLSLPPFPSKDKNDGEL